MLRTITPARFTLTAFVLALAPLVNAQAASPVAQFTSGMQNLQLELTDLAPEDGIAPSFLHEAQISVRNHYDFDLLTRPISGSQLLPSEPFALTFEERDAMSITPTSMEVGISVLAEDLLYAIQPDTTPGTGLSSISSALLMVTYENDQLTTPAIFTLTAHTQITISGDITFSSMLDVSELKTMLPDTGYTSFQLSEVPVHRHFAAIIGFADHEWTGQYPQDSARIVELTFPNEDILMATDETTDVLSVTRTTPFSITFSNTSDESYTGRLLMGAISAPALALTLQGGTIITPPVPEPATYALMGLGLVGIGLAASRRRRAGR